MSVKLPTAADLYKKKISERLSDFLCALSEKISSAEPKLDGNNLSISVTVKLSNETFAFVRDNEVFIRDRIKSAGQWTIKKFNPTADTSVSLDLVGCYITDAWR